MVTGGRGRREEEGVEEMDINREEVREAIKRLKDGKALGWDKIPGKAWKYGREAVREVG